MRGHILVLLGLVLLGFNSKADVPKELDHLFPKSINSVSWFGVSDTEEACEVEMLRSESGMILVGQTESTSALYKQNSELLIQLYEAGSEKIRAVTGNGVGDQKVKNVIELKLSPSGTVQSVLVSEFVFRPHLSGFERINLVVCNITSN